MARKWERTEYRRGRTVVWALHAHLVFLTKYRRGVLSPRSIEVVREGAQVVCTDFGAHLVELSGEDDHVHLLVEYPPMIPLSRLVNSLKGVTSRRVQAANLPEVQEKLVAGHLWSPSYFAASCGGDSLTIVRQYIESQRD